MLGKSEIRVASVESPEVSDTSGSADVPSGAGAAAFG